MEAVKSQNHSTGPNKVKKKLSKEDIDAKIKAKFGEKAEKKKAPEEKVEFSDKSKAKAKEGESTMGDIGSNKPDAAETREKLKSILKMGGFDFNDKERKALATILK